MTWCPATRLFPNFPRVFPTGIALVLIAPLVFFRDFEWKNCDTKEYILSWIIFFNWIFSVLITFAMFNRYRFCYIVRDKKIQMPRDQKIKDLRIGVVGLLICAIIQLVTCISMTTGDGIGFALAAWAHCAAILLVGSYILEQSYMCKFPKKYEKIHRFTMLFAALFGICSLVLDGTNRLEIAGYIGVIGLLLVDGYILFFHSSEIHFLKEFVEKQVICKDKRGNEWRGRFASVDFDHKETLYLRLKLTNVEKLRNGEYVEHPETVHIDEIESLKLAVQVDVESIDEQQERIETKIE